MPWSETALRPWILRELAARGPAAEFTRVVDAGAGAGTAREFYTPAMPDAQWTGIEIHEPYATRFPLRDINDDLILADIRTLGPYPQADLWLLADVLEHMEPGDAVTVWQRAREAARWLVLSLPVLPYPQGPEFGNPHEAHVHDWDVGSVLGTFTGIVACALPPSGLAAGAFIAEGLL